MIKNKSTIIINMLIQDFQARFEKALALKLHSISFIQGINSEIKESMAQKITTFSALLICILLNLNILSEFCRVFFNFLLFALF